MTESHTQQSLAESHTQWAQDARDAEAIATRLSLSRLGQWAQDARDAYAVATSLAGTAFVPKEMQQRPDLVTAAILTGQEIGLDPMASLRSIDIIQGVPAMRANTMRGLVQANGHEVWVDDDDSSETRAVVYGRRKGSTIIQRSTWTMDRARNLGLAGRDNYKKQPGAMLIARATSEVCRLIASDVLLGMPYAVEELDDESSSEQQPAKSKPKRKRTAQRQPLPDAPPLEEPAAAAPADDEQQQADDSTHAAVPTPQPPEAGGADA